jgi:hypothetical protein
MIIAAFNLFPRPLCNTAVYSSWPWLPSQMEFTISHVTRLQLSSLSTVICKVPLPRPGNMMEVHTSRCVVFLSSHSFFSSHRKTTWHSKWLVTSSGGQYTIQSQQYMNYISFANNSIILSGSLTPYFWLIQQYKSGFL